VASRIESTGHDGQLPELRLDLAALEHNVDVMASWCR